MSPKINILKKTISQSNFGTDNIKNIKNYTINFVTQDHSMPSRMVVFGMVNHQDFPLTANVGLLVQKNKVYLYVINKQNKWQKINITEKDYSNTHNVAMKINKPNMGVVKNNVYEELMPALIRDKLKITPPISKQIFHSTLIIPISFDAINFNSMRKHNGEILNITFKSIGKILGKGKAFVILDDTLQRWNLGAMFIDKVQFLCKKYKNYFKENANFPEMFEEYKDWQKNILKLDIGNIKSTKVLMSLIKECSLIYKLSKIPSELWKLENKNIIEENIDQKRFEIVHWNDLKQEYSYIDYEKVFKIIFDAYDTNIKYKSGIDSTIKEYLIRNNINPNHDNYKIYWLYALKYLFEECVVFACMMLYLEDKNQKIGFHVYPSGETLAI